MRIKTYVDLIHVCSNDTNLLQFLLDNRLIKRNAICARRNCRRRMRLIRDKSYSDGHIYRCPKCLSKKSIRSGTFFENSRLKISQILFITACWSAKLAVKSTVFMTGVCRKSVCHWYKILRERCSRAVIERTDNQFGGPGVVVQIGESLIAKRKYHIGHVVPEQWIFALYNTSQKVGHVELVDDRSADTLIPIIQRYVCPGTIIYSDQRAAYGQLAQLGYVHQTVNHSENFVDPNTGVCTNAVKAYRSRAKRNIRLHWLSDRDQLPLRIEEFLWRDHLGTNKYSEIFHRMLQLIVVH